LGYAWHRKSACRNPARVDRVPNLPPSRQHLESTALIAGLLAPVTWGFTGVFVRLLHEVPTLAIVAGRLFIAVLALGPWAVYRIREFRYAIRSPVAALMGAYYILATEAFARAPVVEVTLLIGCAPVITVVLEFMRGNRPLRQQVIGACVTVLGLVLFLSPEGHLSTDRMSGYLLALGAAAASATYAVGLRARAQSERPLDPLAMTVCGCLLGAILSCIFLCWSTGNSVVLSRSDFGYLALLGLVSTAVPTLAFGVASARLPSVLTTSLGVTTPFFAAFFAGLILKEWPAPTALPGAVVAIAGVVMVLRSPARVLHHGASSQ
jgi:drug/metabolite transporter, DME family